ncbi:MAG: ferrous iron transport protein B [Ruminococcaceae bacterium]|nr:ferrous iron transport protein B [Oscillospiraceae bacterium]
MKIALIGNPNSGKTTMYNALTGKNETVGNWAGVTIEKKEHPIKKAYHKGEEAIVAVDLPGAYSMSPFTSEESITSSYVKKEDPDIIVNIVDATNLSRSLFFTTQLLELGIPMVVALNKSDINKKKETVIDTQALSAKLGCPVINTVSTSKRGLKRLVEAAVACVGTAQSAPYTEGDVDVADKEAVKLADRRRFAFVNGIVEAVESRKVHTKDKNIGDKIDAILTNKWLGIPIFGVVMTLVFLISQTWLGTFIAEGITFNEGEANELILPGLVSILEMFQGWVEMLLGNANPLLSALLVDGVIGGVIAVVGFLPLVMIMYFLIAVLEDCGYMSRVAVVLDPIFKRVGLSGKSVIPFVIAVGCAVPGVMASRTIHNERERRATAMLAPFMPCGAKIPVIALIAGAFFDNSGWVSALMYFLGIVIIFVGALLVGLLTGHKGRKSYFIIELPEYKMPSFLGAFKSMCSRGWAYIVKAATIILLCNTAVHLMQSFTWRFSPANATASDSILASVAGPVAYLFVPIIGVLSWQLVAAIVTGFVAKENVVGTLAVCFLGTADGAVLADVLPLTAVSALAYLMFNLFSPPCFATIGAMSAEMKSVKWLAAGIGLQLGVGYTVAYLTYTVGTLITAPATLNADAAMAGLIAVLAMVGTLVALVLRAGRRAGA